MTARANSRQLSFSEAAMYKYLLSAQGRHEQPRPCCSRRCTEQRTSAPQGGRDAQAKDTQYLSGSLTQPSLEASGMSPLTFNGLWMGPRIRALIKIGGQDYYRIKTSLIQMPLALCHSPWFPCTRKSQAKLQLKQAPTGHLVMGTHAGSLQCGSV